MRIDNSKEKLTISIFLGIIAGILIIFLAKTTNAATNLLLYMLAFSVMFLIVYEYKNNLFSPVFLYLIKFFIFYVFSAAIWISSSPSKEDYVYSLGLFYCLLALIFFNIGYRSKIGKIIALRIPEIKGSWEKIRVIIAIAISFLIGFISFLLLIYLNGGILNFLAYMWNRSRLIQGLGPLKTLINFIGLSVLINFCSILTCFKKSFLAKLFLFILFLIWSFVCLIFGERGFFLLQLFMILFIYNYLFKRIKIKLFLFILVFVICFLYIMLEIRENSFNFFLKRDYLEIDKIKFFDIKYFVEKNFPFFNIFVILLEKVPHQFPYYLGKTYLESFTSIVPRAIWSKKPFGVSSEVVYVLYGLKFYHTKDLNAPQSGPSIKLIDEAYLNFSIIGIIIMFFIYGLLMRIYYVYLIMNKENVNALLILSILFPFIIYYFDGNSFMNFIRLCEYVLMVIYISLGLKLRFKRI